MRAYCNASRPGFRKFPRCIENQTTVIEYPVLTGFAWEHKEGAGEAIYDFLLLHTSDDAQQVVEWQDENGPEVVDPFRPYWGVVGVRPDECVH